MSKAPNIIIAIPEGKVEIPILKNEARQKEINDLVLKANKFRYEAYLKEQEAIRIVNEDVINASEPNWSLVAEPKIKYKKPEKEISND